MPRTASEIVARLRGTNAAARYFDVQPPSVSAWLESDEIPRSRLIERAAQLEADTAGWFTRAGQWPDDFARIWPELAPPPHPCTSGVPAGRGVEAVHA